jgi:hypothetical protein
MRGKPPSGADLVGSVRSVCGRSEQVAWVEVDYDELRGLESTVLRLF